MKPKRIQRKRTKGWRMPANTIYVGRPSRWGNPIRVTGESMISHPLWKKSISSREFAIEFYKEWIKKSRLIKDINELKGKNLACFCPLDKPCHADILLKLANVKKK